MENPSYMNYPESWWLDRETRKIINEQFIHLLCISIVREKKLSFSSPIVGFKTDTTVTKEAKQEKL